MATKKGNPDQYLQKVGGTYYARVRVPRTLEKFTGQTHIRRSLGTSSRSEANLKKHAVVARIKLELAQLRSKPPKADEPGLTFEDARAIREQLDQLQAIGDHETRSTVEMVTLDHAEQLERLYGPDKARRWYRTATSSDETLTQLMERWLGGSDYRESTKYGHRKALKEVLAFMGKEDAYPNDITLNTVIAYIDTDLTQRGLAHSTIRDRLVSLGGFWGWMASRNAVPKGANPWAGHRISKKQNAGTRPPKRAFTDDELLALLNGNDRVKSWPTYSYIPDLMLLGLFTGAREDELCSLLVGDVEPHKDHCVIRIKDSKTKAGIRWVAVADPVPMAVLKRRMHKKAETAQLFHELTPGGLDDKLSASSVKAFGRYRRVCGVPDGTDFHSFRRNVVTVLEAARVDQVAIARFVGHKVGTLAADVYSQGGTKESAVETARRVGFGDKVVTAARALAGLPQLEGPQ